MISPGKWMNGPLPANVSAGAGTVITGELAFKRFHGERADALRMGEQCTMDGVHFDLGKAGKITIGDYCYFTNVVLLCELEVQVGSFVLIGWNTTITDTDFHPIAPADRIADAIACSPLGKGRPRPAVVRRPVIIEDEVWVGPNATILKGVRLGRGAFVEPGALVTKDVPPRMRVMGNPAQIIGKVE
jgi:acetyltransferase-like isoleucine patch superfamily enzyme